MIDIIDIPKPSEPCEEDQYPLPYGEDVDYYFTVDDAGVEREGFI